MDTIKLKSEKLLGDKLPGRIVAGTKRRTIQLDSSKLLGNNQQGRVVTGTKPVGTKYGYQA